MFRIIVGPEAFQRPGCCAHRQKRNLTAAAAVSAAGGLSPEEKRRCLVQLSCAGLPIS
jgi:hypothetical protein